jgi:cell division protein FtsB
VAQPQLADPKSETRADSDAWHADEGRVTAAGPLDAARELATPHQTGEPTHASLDARMHPVTLRFPKGLNEQFADEYFTHTLAQVRLGLVLAIGLYAIFGVLDTWIAPTNRRELWLIRYAIECPLLAACLVFSYAPAFRRFREIALSAIVLIMALGIIGMTAIIPAPGSYLYYAGLVLVVVYAFTLVRLTVPYATTISGVVIAIYVVVALWLIETPAALLINNLFFLVSSTIIGFLANYAMERYARTNFLQRRVIELHTGALEQKTEQLEQTNAQLVARNRELAESRAATIRSAQRSELIFSALSEALPGTVLDDKYRVEEKIGSGGFGTVYRGEHILLHHPVAIKVFRPVVGNAALQSLDRFRVEGISACRINHPNAVTVLDFDVSAGSLAYLVMELLQGQSLSDELAKVGKLAAGRCARIMAAVCSVLAQAHAAGIVHRDVKPSNVFLHHGTDEELVKVIDFGIAKLSDETRDPELQAATATGMFVGTPAYMAPERLMNEPYDGRADVYSVGVMMFETLCGRLPFQTSGPGAYWSAAMLNPLRPLPAPHAIEPSVPAELEAAIIRAMAVEPNARPTAAELEAHLRQFLESEESGRGGVTRMSAV